MFHFFHSKRYLALSCGLNFANSCDITTTTSIVNVKNNNVSEVHRNH